MSSLLQGRDALLALQSGKVAAYFTDSPVAGYYVVQQPTLSKWSRA